MNIAVSTSPVGLELLTRSTLRLNRSQRHRPIGRPRGFIDTVAKERLPRVRLGPATPYGLLRMHLFPRTGVNKGKMEGQSTMPRPSWT
jgi:hypothetical protein